MFVKAEVTNAEPLVIDLLLYLTPNCFCIPTRS